MKALLGVSLLVAAGLPWSAARLGASAEPSRWVWDDVPRVVAVGDVHGGYDKLVRLLKGAELVDGELGWSGGEDHLVVAGDFLDRGGGDRPLMELLMRLEEESRQAGGRVHALLGNHEVMNLMWDTRDVASYADFAGEETKAERRAALRRYMSASAPGRTLQDSVQEFRRRFPRGFFARQRAFRPAGRYGGWLVSLPAIVKVNGVAYLHGGLTEEVARLGIDAINRRLQEVLRRHLTARERLEQQQHVTAVMTYSQLLAAARELVEREPVEEEARAAAEELLETAGDLLLGERGPLWYRGSALEDERIERETLENALELIGARATVVAHSYTGGNRITSRFHGRLIRLDHGILGSPRPLALVVEKGEVLVLDPETRSKIRPIRELPTGGVAVRPAGADSDEELHLFLAEAAVVDSRELGRGSTRPRLLRLQREGERRRGIFKTVDDVGEAAAGGVADSYRHEVAAYRLDRMLGLGLVPVTVLRSLDGEEGSLQTWVEGAVDRATAVDYGLPLYTTESAARQLARGAVFDALIANPGRRPSDILCLLSGGRVYLIDHSKAFTTSPELAGGGADPLAVPSDLAAALRALDRASLTAELGGLLSEAQLDAVLERRDRILAGAGEASAVAR